MKQNTNNKQEIKTNNKQEVNTNNKQEFTTRNKQEVILVSKKFWRIAAMAKRTSCTTSRSYKHVQFTCRRQCTNAAVCSEELPLRKIDCCV